MGFFLFLFFGVVPNKQTGKKLRSEAYINLLKKEESNYYSKNGTYKISLVENGYGIYQRTKAYPVFTTCTERERERACRNMAETLSPFVYWGQTSDVVSLKIALRNTEVALSMCLIVHMMAIHFRADMIYDRMTQHWLLIVGICQHSVIVCYSSYNDGDGKFWNQNHQHLFWSYICD